MAMSRFVPPLDYLREASRTSLQSFELARLNHAANLRREIAALIDQWIQESSEATLARYILDQHESFHQLPSPAAHALSPSPAPAADLLPDSPAPPAEIVHAPPRFSDATTRVGEPAARKPRKQKFTALA